MIGRQSPSRVVLFALLLSPLVTGCAVETAGAEPISAQDEVAGRLNAKVKNDRVGPEVHRARGWAWGRGWADDVDNGDTDVAEETDAPTDTNAPVDPVDTGTEDTATDPVDTGTEDTATDTVVPTDPVVDPPPPVDTALGGQLQGFSLYVDPDSNASRQAASWRQTDPVGAALMDQMADRQIGLWIGDWYSDVAGAVDEAVTAGGDGLRTLVVYNIPNRDCGAWSAGGVANKAAYDAFIADFARGLGGRPAIIVLEPDALPLTECLTASQTTERYQMISEAVDTLTAAGGYVYIDAGDSDWLQANDIADRLVAAGVDRAAGFALNVSHTETTENSIAYAEVIRARIGDVHYIIDTDRNGTGPTATHEWCNPLGVAAGADPSVETGVDGLDAYLWVKPPGESDGPCNGGPSAGAWWPSYARAIAAAAWL